MIHQKVSYTIIAFTFCTIHLGLEFKNLYLYYIDITQSLLYMIFIAGYIVTDKLKNPRLGIELQGAFLSEYNASENAVFVYIQLLYPKTLSQYGYNNSYNYIDADDDVRAEVSCLINSVKLIITQFIINMINVTEHIIGVEVISSNTR